MLRFDHDFVQNLKDFDFETIENERNSVYAISKEYKIIYLNNAYLEFANTNNGEPMISHKFGLGSYLPDAIHGNFKKDYCDKIDLVFATGKSNMFFYECSSDKVFRKFMQKIYPLRNQSGVLVLNSLIVENNIDEEISQPSLNYVQPTGFINQCSNCRRTQSSINEEKWEWVPDYITKMPKNVSHTICPMCFDYYWKNA